MFADTVRAALAAPHRTIEPRIGTRRDFERLAARLRPALMGSQRFVLDADVSHAVGALGLGDMGILAAALPMARLPFPRTWIEIDLPSVLRGAGRVPEGCPEVLAYLLEEADPESGAFAATAIMPVMDGATVEIGRVTVSPVAVVVDPVGQHRARDPGGEAGRLLADLGIEDLPSAMDSILMGSGFQAALRGGQLEEAARMASHAAIVYGAHSGFLVRAALADPDRRVAALGLRMLRQYVTEMAGDFRRILAALALINARERSVAWDSRPAGDAPVPGATFRGRPYLEYRTVSLKVPRALVLSDPERHLLPREGRPRRRHSVVAHWCHSRKVGDPRCGHEWNMIDPRRFVCGRCGMKRWRRDASERGDASLGYVVKDRRLEAGEGLAVIAGTAPEEDSA